MKEDTKESHSVYVTAVQGNLRLRNILCKVYLPSESSGLVRLHFLPNKKQSCKVEKLSEFRVFGSLRVLSGEACGRIDARKVYILETKRQFSGIRGEALVVGEPTSLTITNYIKRDALSSSDRSTRGAFWLTPSAFLRPFIVRRHYGTGRVTVRHSHKFKFLLGNGHQISFTKYFSDFSDDDGREITTSELVAEYHLTGTEKYRAKQFVNLLKELDDFLLLCSFANRRRCICVGWGENNGKSHVKHYRRGLVIPTEKKDNYSNTVIDLQDFRQFIRSSYHQFRKLSEDEKKVVRQAIHYTIPKESGTLETSFTMLYSTLETLLANSVNTIGVGNIFTKEEWPAFKSDFKSYLKNQQYLVKDKERRKLVYEKLGELNRVSFRTAFSKLCVHYKIGLSDLWPVIESSDGPSLSDIRNRLIHGGTFTPAQYPALIAARENLRWIAERLLLAVLKWPVAKSRVSGEYLNKTNRIYRQWPSDRAMLL